MWEESKPCISTTGLKLDKILIWSIFTCQQHFFELKCMVCVCPWVRHLTCMGFHYIQKWFVSWQFCVNRKKKAVWHISIFVSYSKSWNLEVWYIYIYLFIYLFSVVSSATNAPQVIQKHVKWVFLDIQLYLTTATTVLKMHVQSNIKQLTGINWVVRVKLLVRKWFQAVSEKLQRNYPSSLSLHKTNNCLSKYVDWK